MTQPPVPLDCERRVAHALELAYRHLGRRDRTEAQLRRHLTSRGVKKWAIDEGVRRMREQGYLDDARYARIFAEDRRALDGWGSERIAQALVRAGVSGELVAAAIGERDAESELAAAVVLLRRRCRSPPATDRDRERALRLLVRKGYELELAYDAVRAFERAAIE